jgi:hypothetical protein
MNANKTEDFAMLLESKEASYAFSSGGYLIKDKKIKLLPVGDAFCIKKDENIKNYLNFGIINSLNNAHFVDNIEYFPVNRENLGVQPGVAIAIFADLVDSSYYNSESLTPLYIKGVNAKTIQERKIIKDI